MAQGPASATAKIYIDQTAAELALRNLQNEATKLAEKIKKGEEAGKSMVKEIASLDKTNAAIKSVQDQIDKGLKPSFLQQQKLVNMLRNDLKRMSEDAPGYAAKFQAFQKASAEFNRMKDAISGVEKAQRSWMADAKTVAFGVLIGNTVQTALESIGSYFSGIISGNAKLSDSLSDIEKSTGMSAAQVAKLNKELGTIDTRTKSSELREIAVGLGQIGEAADKANVQAIDQIVVALGDEFGGGAREITTTLSVLRNNLSDIKTGNYAEDVGRIGNALNVLGAEGLATAPVVTDIANRIAGVGRTFKLSSGEIFGVAATFQELGINAERGSTAFTKVMQKIGAEPEKFAKVAGVSAKKFKQMVNDDMLGAFVAVAEGAKKAGSNNVVFASILKELDADGSGAGEVLSKLGQNADLLSTKVNTATEAFKSNGSILEEFSKKNTNLAAELEKLDKDINSMITSKTLADIFTAGVTGARHFIAAIKQIPTFLKENQTAVYLIITGIALMNASLIQSGLLTARDTVLKLYNAAATKATAIATNIATASQAAYGIIVQLVTGRITFAAAAQRIWNATMTIGAGPIGVIITLVGALIVAMGAFKTEAEGAAKVEQDMMNIRAEAAKAVTQEKVSLEALLLVARDETKSKAERQKAIEEINKISPEYLGNITLENINTNETKTAIDNYIIALDKKALAQAYMSKLQELYNKQIEIENSSLEDNVAWYETLWNTIKGGGNAVAATAYEIESGIKNRKDNVVAIRDEIAALKEKMAADIASGTVTIPGADPAPDNPINPFGDDKKNKAAQKRAQLLQEIKDFQIKLEGIGKVQEEREIDQINNKYNKLLKEATQYGISLIEVEKARSAAIRFLLDKEERERKEKQQKAFVERSKTEYGDSLVASQEYFDSIKDQEAERYAAGTITKTQYEENVKAIDRASTYQQIMIAQDYSATVKEAADDVVKFKKKKRKEDLQDAVASTELERQIARRNELAAAQRAVINSQPLTQSRLQAQLALLAVEREQALAAENVTEEEKKKIRDEFRLKELQTVKDFYIAQINETLNFLSSSLDVVSKFNDAKSAKEKAALDQEIKNNQVKRDAHKRAFDAKLITEQEYKKQISKLDAEEARKKEDLDRKQKKRQQGTSIAQALINGAQSVTKTIAEWGMPFALPFIALAVASTAAQIATITSQKFEKGGILDGPRHSNGGMPVYNPRTGKKVAEMEGGEAILSRDTVKNNPDIVSRLLDSSMNRGGERITPFWESRSYRSVDFGSVTRSANTVRHFDNGGIFPGDGSTQDTRPAASPVVVKEDPEIKNLLAQNIAINRRLSKQIEDGLEIKFSLHKLDEAYLERDLIDKDAGP